MTSQRHINATFVLLACLHASHAAFQFHANILRTPSTDINSRMTSNASHRNNHPRTVRSRSHIPLQISMQDQQGDIPISSKEPDSSTAIAASPKNSKLSTLKDRMWVREALEDLTAAEFACSIAASSAAADSESSDDGKKKRNDAMDIENILSKLEKRIEDMCVLVPDSEKDDSCLVSYPLSGSDGSSSDGGGGDKGEMKCWVLKKNFGMGSVTYTDDQRNVLVVRLLASRANLLQAMSGKVDSPSASDLDKIREQLQTPDAIDEEPKEKDKIEIDLYVRDDGTIDWDGALQDRAALKKFGISVWARINGQDADDLDEDSVKTDSVDNSHGDKKVTVKIADTPEIKEKKEKLEILEAELQVMEKAHTALLNSAVSAGSAVANVNLATLDPAMRSKIRDSDNELERKRVEVSFQKLNYEFERIYTYLDGELGNTSTKGYIPLQDRLNVAEFGLFETQLANMNTQIATGEDVDSDVLSVILDATADFKRRLGIDYYVAGLTFDVEAIKIWANDLIGQSQTGIKFYAKGCQLLWNDVVFSSSLIGRALQGYTLKPREVRTLRRTFKDVVTFIPVVVILIIPLTPVGHVLVFGAIQRFFPDFFPSCFSERRQNLFSLYESTEYTDITIKENWQEQMVRVTQAAGFVMVDKTKHLLGLKTDQTNGNDDSRI